MAYLSQDGIKEVGGFQPASYTVLAADATANTVTLTMGDLPSVEIHLIQIYRAGVDVKDAAVITTSGNTITIADGGTYALTAGDVVHMMIAGKSVES